MDVIGCRKCGFLCWEVSDSRDEWGNTLRYDELIEIWRDQMRFERSTKHGVLEAAPNNEDNRMRGLRKQWIFGDGMSDDRKIPYSNSESIFGRPTCAHSMKHEPGDSTV